MKLFISIWLSVMIFGASFQNSLYFIDYQINKDYYKAMCINKLKPELDCSGKCQVRKEAQKEENPISQIKYSFELNVLPANNNQSFVGSERPTMKLLLNGSFGSSFQELWGCRKIFK